LLIFFVYLLKIRSLFRVFADSIPAVGQFAFPQLAIFYSASWPVPIPAVGHFLFRQLAGSHSGSWPFFIPPVAKGERKAREGRASSDQKNDASVQSASQKSQKGVKSAQQKSQKGAINIIHCCK